MFGRLFRRRKKPRGIEPYGEKSAVLADLDEAVRATLDVLGKEGKRSLDEAREGVEKAVKEAAQSSLRDLGLMEEGRCPECGRKLIQFLFTSVCTNCGWASYIMPEKGSVTLHLYDGSIISCQAIFDTKGGTALCIHNDVVRARVDKRNISHVDFNWPGEEVERRRAQYLREARGICEWCEKPFNEAYGEHLKRVEEAKAEGRDPERPWEPIVVYAAFGTAQNRYRFCCERCEEGFKRQYPVRVHRNCYDRPCPGCDLCAKKYEGHDETLLKRLEMVV